MNVSQKITNIINYYSENPDCDPNMFEFVSLCYDMVQYLQREAPDHGINRAYPDGKSGREHYPIACAVYDKFRILSKEIGEKLLNNDLDITKESPLYQLYRDVSISVGTYSTYLDTLLRQKLSGVSLFIAQKNRDVRRGLIPEFTYDNEYEMEEIQRLNKELPNPQAYGHYVKEEGSEEFKYVASEPSVRQKLLEEITNEYQKGSRTR